MTAETPPRSGESDIKDSVRHQFGQVASNYRSSTVHAQGKELVQMLRLANLSGTETVLDAGCGPGHTALYFAPHVKSVIAVDLSPEMLEQGRHLASERGLTNVEFRLGDVEALPFDDDVFDIVTSRYSAHHWPDPRRALGEFRRVLVGRLPSVGQLLLADVVSFDEFTLDTHLQAIELLRDPSHVRDHTIEQWHSMLATAGFQANMVFDWTLRLEFVSWVERMATPDIARQMIKQLFDNAPSDVIAALQIEGDHTFTVPCALFHGVVDDG